jgi:tRNA (guanine-N7-)-methyltransferase
MNERPHRKIRSFVRRPGRTTDAQRKALERLMPTYGIDYSERRIDLVSVFGREASVVLDIGFGNGEALVTLAAGRPETDFLGVEIHEPGIGRLLLLLERAQLSNVRVIEADAVEVVSNMLADASLDGINLFFPDPWPKKRHHKRRLVQPPMVEQFARVMKPGGRLHLATDWEDYAEHMREVVEASGKFVPLPREQPERAEAPPRPPTKFERRGQLLGHEVRDLIYERREP